MDGVKPTGGVLGQAVPRGPYSFDVLRPCEPLPLLHSGRCWAQGGIAFEAEVFERITEAVPVAVVVDKGLPREPAGTVDPLGNGEQRPNRSRRSAAGRSGVAPCGRAGLCSFAPTCLGTGGSSTQSTYLPVDVKHHLTLAASGEGLLGPCPDRLTRLPVALRRRRQVRTSCRGGSARTCCNWPTTNECSSSGDSHRDCRQVGRGHRARRAWSFGTTSIPRTTRPLRRI